METCSEFKSKDYNSKCILLMAKTGSDTQLNGLSKASLCHQRMKIMLFVEKLGGIKKWCKMEK